jgi:hypothetical protein
MKSHPTALPGRHMTDIPLLPVACGAGISAITATCVGAFFSIKMFLVRRKATGIAEARLSIFPLQPFLTCSQIYPPNPGKLRPAYPFFNGIFSCSNIRWL